MKWRDLYAFEQIEFMCLDQERLEVTRFDMLVVDGVRVGIVG